MKTAPGETDEQRAAYHAELAERLLKGRLRLISSHVTAQAHATLAVYYSMRNGRDES